MKWPTAAQGKRLLKTWRDEPALRRRLANVGHLLTGSFLTSLIGLGTFALTARAIGPADYGVLALIYAYVRAVERIVSFQSWQPLIKYGAALYEERRIADLAALLKFGLLLDLGAALLAWLLAIGIALAIGTALGWSDVTLHLVVLYCSVLLFKITGMPTAVLRLSGQFKIIAIGQVAKALIHFSWCGIGIFWGGELYFFILVWMGMSLLGSVTLLGFTFRQLRHLEVRGLWRAPLSGITQRFPGIWSFAWSANLSLTIRSSAHELDTLIVGALADPASAGLYQIAKRVGRLAQQVGVQVQTVLYPDVARLWAKGAIAAFRRAILQVEVLLASFGLACFLFFLVSATPLLAWTAGPGFEAAAPLLVVQMVAVMMTLMGTALRSALLAMGRQREVLQIVTVATVGFHLTALLLVPRMGAMGANIGHIVLGGIWMAGLAIAFRRSLATAPSDASPLSATARSPDLTSAP